MQSYGGIMTFMAQSALWLSASAKTAMGFGYLMRKHFGNNRNNWPYVIEEQGICGRFGLLRHGSHLR